MSARLARWALAAAALLLAVLPTASAGAEPLPLSPVNLSAGGQDAEAPQVAVDPAGDAVAVWSRSNGANDIVQAATRPGGGSWSAAVDLSTAGRDATEAQVAIDAAGNAVAVWSRFNGSRTVIQAATMATGGGWSAPVDLSNAEWNAEAPQVAVDPAGDAVAVWSRYNGLNDIVQAVSRPAGGSWSEALNLSVAGRDATEAQVAIDAAGNAVAVWSRYDGADFIVQSSTRAPGGSWSMPPTDLSATGGPAKAPQVAVDPAGDAVAVWSRDDGSDDIVQAASRQAGGAWSGGIDLSVAGRDSDEAAVAIGPGGEAVAVWTRDEVGFNMLAQAAVKTPGGSWSGAVGLSPAGTIAEAPRVAVDGAGDAIAVWSNSDASPSVILSSTRPAGGVWGGSRRLSELGENSVDPQIALDSDGDGVGLWTRETGAHPVVQALGFDGSPPRLRAVTIPGAATMEQPVSFSASPFDVWSPIASVRWTFGDEAGSSGTAVSNTYARPGQYRASVTVTDGLGRTSEASGTVTVYPKARAGRNVLVKGRRAKLRVHCLSPAGCEGVAKLIAAVDLKRGKRVNRKRLSIGSKQFAIPGATSVTLSIKITAAAAEEAREAGRRGLKAQLTGPGIKHRLVALFAARG